MIRRGPLGPGIGPEQLMERPAPLPLPAVSVELGQAATGSRNAVDD
jgi:hypothetical protein